MLDITQIESFHKKTVTVRTKSGENLSQDSMVCQVPDDLLEFTAHRKVQQQKHCKCQLDGERLSSQDADILVMSNNCYKIATQSSISFSSLSQPNSSDLLN